MFFYNDLEYPIELGPNSGRLFLPTSQASVERPRRLLDGGHKAFIGSTLFGLPAGAAWRHSASARTRNPISAGVAASVAFINITLATT